MQTNIQILILIFCYFFIKDSCSYYNEQNDRKEVNMDRININSPNLPLNPNGKEYGIQTVKTAIAYVPRRNQRQDLPINVIPDIKKTEYYFVESDQKTFEVPIQKISPKSYRRQINVLPIDLRNQTMTPNYHTVRANHHRRHGDGDCIKCPTEKIVVAQKGYDGVLIEQPKLFSCHNRLLLNTAFQIENLFGSQFKFLLPRGTHSFHGKIRNKKTGLVQQTCILRYKVIVQQCGRYFPQDTNLRVRCDIGYIWGSKCKFSCRTGYLSHNKQMVCGDSLQWEGDVPKCLSEPPPPEPKPCDFLSIPDNGKFSCEYPSYVNTNDYDNEITTPEGTICRVQCDRNFEIPEYFEHQSVLKCESGRWNSTIQNICLFKRRNY